MRDATKTDYSASVPGRLDAWEKALKSIPKCNRHRSITFDLLYSKAWIHRLNGLQLLKKFVTGVVTRERMWLMTVVMEGWTWITWGVFRSSDRNFVPSVVNPWRFPGLM